MKRFLKVVLLTCVLLIPLVGIIEMIPRQWENDYTHKYHYLKDNSSGIKTLLLGSSYFWNSVNPHLLGDSVFDCAMEMRDMYWDLDLLRKNISNMPNLKTVMVPLGYVQLCYESLEIHTQTYWYQTYMGLSHEDWWERLRGYSAIINKQSDLNRYKEKRNAIFRDDSLGCLLYDGHQTSDWKEMQNIPEKHSFNHELIQKRTSYLEEMAQICQEHGVRFIVVTPPCHDLFVERTLPTTDAYLHKMIADAGEKYPIEYRNYLRDTDFRADSLFYNVSHLNHEGADAFAIRLRQDFDIK